MKTNQPAVQSTAQPQFEVAHPYLFVIPPVLLECLAQLKEVRMKIDRFYEESQLQQDLCCDEYGLFDKDINGVARNVSEMIRVELLDNSYYSTEEDKI